MVDFNENVRDARNNISQRKQQLAISFGVAFKNPIIGDDSDYCRYCDLYISKEFWLEKATGEMKSILIGESQESAYCPVCRGLLGRIPIFEE